MFSQPLLVTVPWWGAQCDTRLQFIGCVVVGGAGGLFQALEDSSASVLGEHPTRGLPPYIDTPQEGEWRAKQAPCALCKGFHTLLHQRPMLCGIGSVVVWHQALGRFYLIWDMA